MDVSSTLCAACGWKRLVQVAEIYKAKVEVFLETETVQYALRVG